MDEVIKDLRFSHIQKDPRFKKIPKKHVKVKIDKRFQSMFNEKKFQININVDKRGRKINMGGVEDLKRYYALSDSDKEEIGDEDNKVKSEEKFDDGKNSKKIKEKQNQDVIKLSKRGRTTPTIKMKLKDLTTDYARGEGAIFSDTTSDEGSSDSEEADYAPISHDWGELDKDAENIDEATNRLAVCNMNWDRIEAADLMVLFNSFLPLGGLIHSITIYPSEFGLKRMKEEEEKGPVELRNAPEKEEEGINYIQIEKLRTYQLNRLKYYYAVIVCNSPETADALYRNCDGLEYESSSSKLDLRFIPMGTTFDQEPKETCTALPDLASYKPKLFMTSALTKVKCDLTWDENDPIRGDIVKSIHRGNIDENHLKKYLACSSSSESEIEEKEKVSNLDEKSNTNDLGKINKYKALLAEIENKEKNIKKNEVNLEVSWNLKLKSKANEIVREAAKEKERKTPFQQYLEKRKEKKMKKKEDRKAHLEEKGSDDFGFNNDDIPSDIDMNDQYFKEEFEAFKKKKPSRLKKREEIEDEESKQKKAELELLLLGNEADNPKHFSLKKIEENEKSSNKKKKAKKRKAEETSDFQDDFKINVNDERFSALFTSHHFNIDPADPQFKHTKATMELIQEKLRRRKTEESQVSLKVKTSNKDERRLVNKAKNTELAMVVKNIKKNTSEACKKVRRF